MSNKLKTIIIDDEKGSINALLWELDNFKDDIDVLATSTDPIGGKKLIIEHKPDLVFLDIEMPGMTGFQLVESLENISFHIVFTTAYDRFALKAFEVSACDYLLKPVDEDSLNRTISKIKKSEGTDGLGVKLQALLEQLQIKNVHKNISLPTQEGLEFINSQSIIRCESDSNYSRIFTTDDKPLLVSKTLKEVESLLDNNAFFRIHHSHLINLNYLKKYLKGKGGSVILKDGSQIPVARSRKGDFLEGI